MSLALAGPLPTLAEIRAEWARRAGRGSLAAFCGLIEVPGAPIEDDEDSDGFRAPARRQTLARHHVLLIEALELVERGEIKRLMVFMPPGSAKSSYASVVFPVWFMGLKRRRNVIVATYASDLARKIGRRARSILRQPAYRRVFGTGLSPDSSAADEWALDNENEFMGGGILSGITGNRADLIVIDDPIKGRQQADSETIRNTTRAAYDDDLKTRLKPGGRIVLIQTRWHEDDLAGSLLPENYDGESGWVQGRDGENWYVLCVPAEATRADDPLGRRIGEMLWPEWFTTEHWNAFRPNHRTWAALYQQRPQPDDGSYFQRAWFRRYGPNDLPKSLNIYGTSDYAVTDGGGDYTVLRLWGVDPRGDLWLLPWGYRAQASSDAWIERQIDLIAKHRPFAWFGEAGVIQKAIEPMLKRRMRERRTFCRMEWLPSIADKPTRARGFQARAAMGAVWLPQGAVGDAVIDEYLRFPAGRHDDEVDTASLIGRALDEAHPAVMAIRPVEPPRDRWDAEAEERSADAWKVA